MCHQSCHGICLFLCANIADAIWELNGILLQHGALGCCQLCSMHHISSMG